MEENNPNLQPNIQQPVTPQPEVEVKKGKNPIIWIMLLIILVITVVGGALWFVLNQGKITPTASNQDRVTANPLNDLSNEANAIDLGDLDKEFVEVDKDLGNL